MAAFTLTASATSPIVPGVKKRRKRSSTNLRNPRRRSPKRKSRKKRSRKKNPSRLNQAAPTRRPFFPEVRCEDHLHHSPDRPDPHSSLYSVWDRTSAIAALHHLRSDPRENLHARREHHRRRHTHHPRWKNCGGWCRLGHSRGGAGDRRKRSAGLPGIL